MLEKLRSINLAKKLVILSLLPCLVATAFALQLIAIDKRKLNENSALAHNIELSGLLDNIAHQHAVERGLSAGFLGSKGEIGGDKLKAQRFKADAAWNELATNVDTTTADMPPQTRQLIDNLSKLMRNKSAVRDRVDKLSPDNGAFSFYSSINQTALNAIEGLQTSINNTALSKNYYSYLHTLWVKERAGQVRGMMNGTFKSGALSDARKATIKAYIASRQDHQFKAIAFAPPEQLAAFEKLTNSPPYKQVDSVERMILSDSGKISDIDASIRENWFPIATESIKTAKQIADAMAANLKQTAEENVISETTSLLIDSTLLVLLLAIISIYVVWQVRDISRRLAHLTNGLSSAMNQGEFSMRTNDPTKDELGKISQSVDSFMTLLCELISDLRQMSENLSRRSEELAEITAKNRHSIDAQNQQTQVVASAITEMSASIAEVAKSTQDAADATRSASTASQHGEQTIRRTIEEILQLNNAIQEADQSIDQVAENCSQIETILDTIRGIAEQTNLLALNAAIEAARAGEQGRGFAVVADEVRSLAQRTQISTEEINGMIEALRSSTASARQKMDISKNSTEQCKEHSEESGEEIARISSLNDNILALSTQVATASEQQAHVAEELSSSIVAISDNAQSLNESATFVETEGHELKELADSLANKISFYKVS